MNPFLLHNLHQTVSLVQTDLTVHQMMRGIFVYLGSDTPPLPSNTENTLKKNITQMKWQRAVLSNFRKQNYTSDYLHHF